MEQKMRIQLFDPEFNQISDRLVTQGPEFDKGPKNIEQVKGGGIKVEFSLFTAQDVDLCITYLRQLVGDLPLDAPKQKRGRKKLNASSPNFRDELIDHISTILSSTELVEYLKAEGFVFTTLDYLEDLGNPIAVSKSHRKRYKWLVRLIRQAKNPLNNRYDISILIGFRGEKLMVYSGEEILHKATLTNSIEIHIKVPVKFKVKFPPYMQHDERAQFRAQMEKLKNDLEMKPTRLYNRWLSEVMMASPKEIGFPRASATPHLYDKSKTVEQVQIELKEEKEKDA